MLGRKTHQTLAPLAFGLGLLLAAGHAAAQLAGEVEFARGVGFAQTPGQAPRTLGKGLPLREGDRLTTSEGASAVIKLDDGTRMTVRPNCEIVLQQFQFKENAGDNAMLMQLVRGGFRAVTGLISKNSPNAARVQTSTATIGIRGTDFDARLCTRECGTESSRVTESARPNAVLASAKVFSVQGEVVAVDAANQRRRLVDGGSIYPGDVVESGGGARAVLVFRDESRVSVGASARFRVDNFVYDDQNAGEGRFLASLLRGSIRAVTGLIAKNNARNVGFATPTATIGIRGTEFTASCPGDCTSGNLSLFALLGAISFQQTGQNALQLLQAGQGLFITPTGITPINTPPPSDTLAPGTVQIAANTFGRQEVSDAQEGLFVFVRDGHIEVATAGDILHLGKGEAGFAGNNGQTVRPTTIPKFIDFDKLPLPTARNPLLVSVLADNNIKPSTQCK